MLSCSSNGLSPKFDFVQKTQYQPCGRSSISEHVCNSAESLAGGLRSVARADCGARPRNLCKLFCHGNGHGPMGHGLYRHLVQDLSPKPRSQRLQTGCVCDKTPRNQSRVLQSVLDVIRARTPEASVPSFGSFMFFPFGSWNAARLVAEVRSAQRGKVFCSCQTSC